VLNERGTLILEPCTALFHRRYLEELEVKQLEKRKFKAFGGNIKTDIGEVGIELMGRRRTVTVILGEEEDITVLGVTALESFRLE